MIDHVANFHKVLKGRLNKSRIMSIYAEDGKRYDNCDVIDQFVKHFQAFLGISPDVTKLEDNEGTIFDNKVFVEETNQMTKDVTDEEIKKALFDIDDNKAPRLMEFFNSGKMLGEINATLISLVPKSMNHQKVFDFRPIACCNVVYKCISKILSNRIKLALTHLVDDNQSAFVPGRAITDNILLTQELLKGYNCVNRPKRCSFKIDIQKAYDTVSWAFIGDLLEKFGFPKKMRDWIMKCITTPKFTIYVNGDRYGYFNGGRGLRQGDTISLYIFTLVMEMLNLILKDEIRKEKEFKYHFGYKQLKIIHLCFADDLIMLCHGDITSVNTLKKALASVLCFVAAWIMTQRIKLVTFFLLKKVNFLEGKSGLERCLQTKRSRRPGVQVFGSMEQNFIGKTPWDVASKKESLLVKWINVVKLKMRSVWNVAADSKDS
ncbi:RNA-directed DNA polymerase, eukaryota, reverse transcriptase zinc-binding domain protein [Tanacetum coccineum]